MLRLHPFQDEPALDGLSLEAALRWSRSELQLQFRLKGPKDQLICPPETAEPRRLDGLWNSTCLEAFFGIPGLTQYWEFNISPSGDWNLYRLEDYRRGLTRETGMGIQAISFQRSVGDSECSLEAEICLDLGETFVAVGELEYSLTAVVEQKDFGLSFWALQHCSDEADFHRRESFRFTEPNNPVNGDNKTEDILVL